MRINESCAACLYDKQLHRTDDAVYLAEVRRLIDTRRETDTAPYLVYLFDRAYEERFGKRASYREIKKQYNDLALSMEGAVREKIEASPEPLETALLYARIGNYIDFGAMNHVDEQTFLRLFENVKASEHDAAVMESLFRQCESAESFLLIADNCGEIVLDKLFLTELRRRFPKLGISVMVRGSEVLNDATKEDAEYVGLTQTARVISSGSAAAGTIYSMLSAEARQALDSADVILAKGQGNYESLSHQGRHIFCSFLCKCELFTERFSVPPLTGMLVEER